MDFQDPLIKGHLIKRYKRFLADVELADGSIITAHCANSGAMTGLKEAGTSVWLSPNRNPKAKLDWRWELVELAQTFVGINTSRPNAIVEEAILAGKIPELAGYDSLKREVKYGGNSRIDILLTKGEGDTAELCYVEVKSVTLRGEGAEADYALFPDAVTTRGTKHLNELADMVKAGHRSVMVYLIQRTDCRAFKPASSIDPVYSQTLKKVYNAGVEALCYQTTLSTDRIIVGSAVPVVIDGQTRDTD